MKRGHMWVRADTAPMRRARRAARGGIVAIVGLVLRLASPAGAALPSDFHWGTMAGGRPLRGTVTAHAVLTGFMDEAPWDHTASDVWSTLTGPAYPNVVDYVSAMSRGGLALRIGGVFGPVAPYDDPDTVLVESTFRDAIDLSNPGILYMAIRSAYPTADSPDDDAKYAWMSAVGGGSGSVTTVVRRFADIDVHGARGAWETFALVDVSRRDGDLVSGDVVAFKAADGSFLSCSTGEVTATGGPFTEPAAQFQILEIGSGSDGLKLRAGDVFVLRSIATGGFVRFAESPDGATRVLADQTTITNDSVFVVDKAAMDDWRYARSAFDRLSSLLDLDALDLNHDGWVFPDELHLWVIALGGTQREWAQTRGSGGFFRPRYASVYVYVPQSYVAEDWLRPHTLAHEMMHQFGTIDLYGHDFARNLPLSLMGAEFDGVTIMDPWHKVRLGWAAPRIAAMNDAPARFLLRMPESERGIAIGTNNPVLLYDPSRYDLAGRQGEFFLLEFRNGLSPRARYDAGVQLSPRPVGLALWQVKTDAEGSLGIVEEEGPVPPGTTAGWDSTCNALAAPVNLLPGARRFRRGNWELWSERDGRIQPPYLDGTLADLAIRVAPTVAPEADGIVVCVASAASEDQPCSPCVLSAPAASARLVVTRLAAPSGDERLRFRGSVMVPVDPSEPSSNPVDPPRNGVRVVLQTLLGTIIDGTVPPGAYDPHTGIGWTANPGQTRWRWRNDPRNGGLSSVRIEAVRDHPGRYDFSVKGTRMSLGVGTVPEDVPTLLASFVLDPPFAQLGHCAEATFSGRACKREPSGGGFACE